MRTNIQEFSVCTPKEIRNDVHMVAPEDEFSVEACNMEKKVDHLTRLVEKLYLQNQSLSKKLLDMEELMSLKSEGSTTPKPSQPEMTCKDSDSSVYIPEKEKSKTSFRSQPSCHVSVSDCVLFKEGEINPKGGLYSYSHKQRVYLTDEGVYGQVVGETCNYVRVVIEGEIYSRTKIGRLKLKANVNKVNA